MIRIATKNKWHFMHEDGFVKSEPTQANKINMQDAVGRNIQVSIHDSEKEALAEIELLKLERHAL